MTGGGTAPTDFSAADSAVGYLYQVRLALLSALQRLASDETFALYLETLDDVVFGAGSALDLLQLKHHCDRAANLTDASPDLWKSLRVWMDGRSHGTIPTDARLFLITTSDVGSGSAASKLTAHDRDEPEAQKRLDHTSTTSTSDTNRVAYELYRALSATEKSALLSRIVIAPRAPDIVSVGDGIRAEARLAVRREHLDPFVARLEGWWFGRALRQLVDEASPPILSAELESELRDLQEQFKRDALPVDRDILEQEVDAAVYENAVFVHQVQLAGISQRRIMTAIRDYYRAFAQRSRWMREELLLVGELDSYERLLREEWELQFNRFADEAGDEADDDAMRQAAHKVYAWVEGSSYPIRPQVQHHSMSRGSFHILADSLRVGWHPQFVDRLRHLLEPREAS
ncbi:MAG: hypothetical protein IPK80_15155 [Nannocystis sp.]|nr:hypothetical protein [Nannocystis sp.]